VTSVATTSPIAGGTITATGTITCTTCLTATTPTNHGVLLGAGSQAVGATSAGTAGNVLTSNGASADPTFQAATGGALVQLETHAASTSASLAFTTCISGSTYHEYVVSFRNIVPATNTTHILLQVSTNGGSSYDTGSNYGWGAWRASGGGATQAGATTDTSIGLDGSGGISSTASKGGFVGRFSLYDPLNGAQFTRIKGEFGANDDGGTVADVVSMIAGSYKVTTAVNAFRIIATTGNLTSGTVTCYGLTP
jgi:hypothetical protein